ncbi:MAG TPA: helix-turn-helix domain-containing protein [Candidatus Mediterraneibacter faecigallinarum]|uniref:Helix-turn-helix domain-containing protein n=1 Tax=Candidatus Mediterraneibacter faecigallinarum TaxID=2838669 RepID=A0A9D2NW17_9FIRM|nr:helix-turn-helix domain-containing protein [Candidatus Mediterraneibacter faecigallinarum]
MELGTQIRKYRNEKTLSQEALAEKVYVSRQTVSNWENDKSYPDVNSLVLLSEVFEISLDQLIKGDVEMMKEQINQTDQKKFERLSNIFTILFLAVLITPVPLVHFLSYAGLAIWIVILGAGSYAAMLVEREKKKFDMQTYREIIAFTEGKSLSEIEKAREEGKRPYQKVLLAVASGAAGVIVTMFFLWLLG